MPNHIFEQVSNTSLDYMRDFVLKNGFPASEVQEAFENHSGIFSNCQAWIEEINNIHRIRFNEVIAALKNSSQNA